jgi:hypothetical protein
VVGGGWVSAGVLSSSQFGNAKVSINESVGS